MDLDQEVASRLHNEGVAVIGWSTLRYFWQARTPERFRRDLARVLNVLPEGMRLFAGGYSFGAEVVPIALAEDPRSEPALGRIQGLVLIGPGRYATFEVSPLDWIFHNTTPTAHPVRTALERKLALPVLCLRPADDEDSGCPPEGRAGLRTVTLPGSHHFGGDYASLAKKIADFLRSTAEGDAAGEPTPPGP